MRLRSDFILEVADCGGEATVGSHVRVAEQTETQLEIERLGERLFLKDAGADNLPGDRHQDFVLSCGKDFNLCDLRFLVKLLSATLPHDKLRLLKAIESLRNGLPPVSIESHTLAVGLED